MHSEHEPLHSESSAYLACMPADDGHAWSGPSSESESLIERIRESKPPRTLVIPWLHEALMVGRQIGDAFSILFGQWAGIIALRAWLPDSALPSPLANITTLTGTGVMLLLMSYVGLNGGGHSILNIRETQKILRSWLIGSIATLLLLYLARIDVPRLAWIATWSAALPALLLHRSIFWRISRWLHRHAIVETSALIYGTGSTARILLKKLRLMPELGIHIAGFIDDDPRRQGDRIDGLPVLGDFTDLATLLRLTGSKRIYIALAQVPRRTITDILAVCRARNVDFQIVPTLHDMALPRIRIEDIDGIPLLGVSHANLRRWRAWMKRATDILLGTAFLVASSPALAIGMIATRIVTKGPMFQTFRRVGHHGKLFRMIRLRIGPHSDAPETLIGNILHRLAIDALPKLLNVIRGDMSLVGPRPPLVREAAHYDEFHHLRLNVRPGLTGLWRILPYTPGESDDGLDLDLQYIHSQSMLLDLSIVLETIRTILLPRKTVA